MAENSETPPTSETTKDAFEKSEAALQTKIKQLQWANEKAESVLKAEKKRAIARHVDTSKEIQSEVNRLRRAVEAGKIAEGVSANEIDKWNDDVESKMELTDSTIERLEEWLLEEEAKVERLQRDQKAKRESQERQERLQFELELHEAKMNLQAKINKPDAPKTTDKALKLQPKLPKLEITKFNGTYADCPRFWSLYSETIDKTVDTPVSKFSYLRELLCEKARKTIEALPHTPEGYNRAVSIL